MLAAYDYPNSADLRSCLTEVNGLALGRLAGLARLALPLGIVSFLISLNTNIPRYFVEDLLGTKALGIFAALGYLMLAGNTLMAALGQSAVARLASYFAQGNKEKFQKLLFQLLAVAVLVGGTAIGIAVLFGERLLTLLYSPDYAEHAETFAWFMIAALSDYVGLFLGNALFALRRFFVQWPVHMVKTTLTLGLSFFLVGRYGLNGAAWAVMGGSLFGTLVYSLIIYNALSQVVPVSVGPGLEAIPGRNMDK